MQSQTPGNQELGASSNQSRPEGQWTARSQDDGGEESERQKDGRKKKDEVKKNSLHVKKES